MMALCDDGRTVGSVSGGCIEDDLVSRYVTVSGTASYPPSTTDVVRYGIDADEAHRFGLPCGGTLELVLEFAPAFDALNELVKRLERGELVRRTLRLSRNEVRVGLAEKPEELYFDGAFLSNTLGPGYRMLLIGAGSLTDYVAAMALFSGFSVTVCDPRRDREPTCAHAGVGVVSDMPDDAVVAFRPDSRSCIVALSHDPKLDDLALLEAIHSPAFYVGAIGSRANNDARRERLMTHFGETEASLARLRGPVGIYIGSKTPAEIGVSIMAEILAAKNGVALPRDISVAAGKSREARSRSGASAGDILSDFCGSTNHGAS